MEERGTLRQIAVTQVGGKPRVRLCRKGSLPGSVTAGAQEDFTEEVT